MINVNLLISQEAKQEQYKALVNARIRKKYSQDEVEAIMRKKIANTDVNNEFEAYNQFAEEVKKQVKLELGL